MNIQKYQFLTRNTLTSIKQLLVALVAVMAMTSCHQDAWLCDPFYNNCLELKFVDKEGNNLLTLKDGQRTMIFDNLEVYRSCSPNFKEKRIKMSIGNVLYAPGELALEENRFAHEYCPPFGWPTYAQSAIFLEDESSENFRTITWTNPRTEELEEISMPEDFLLGFCFSFANGRVDDKKIYLVRYRLVWPEGNKEWILELSYKNSEKNVRFFVDSTEYPIDPSSQKGRTIEIVVD